ncbi:MAG: PH domain-containing protein [archaeon GB-1845-036]|nr:PH domain-containing protein [Candidatus Culexmicrobium thermophilum]
MKEKFTEEEVKEIRKIQPYLEEGEEVLIVARQSRIRPGGSITTPNIIFATNRKLIIRNPSMLGLRESVEVIPYKEITAIHLQKGIFSSQVRITAPGLTTELGRFFHLTKDGVAGIPAIPKDKAVKLVNIVKERMKKIKSEGKAEISPLDELKKLKELLDIGAITPQEYEEKKRKLLRKI